MFLGKLHCIPFTVDMKKINDENKTHTSKYDFNHYFSFSLFSNMALNKMSSIIRIQLILTLI